MKRTNESIFISILGVALASVVGLAYTAPPAHAAESESGGVFSVGESESGGIFSVGESESGGPASVGESESGGPYSVGESESGGIYSVGESESGGPASVGYSETGYTMGYGTSVGGYVPYRASWLWRHAHNRVGPAVTDNHVPEVEVKNYSWPAAASADRSGPIIYTAKTATTPEKKRVVIANKVPKQEWHVGGANIKTVRGHAVTSF